MPSMRHLITILLIVLWAVLLLIYSAPIWLSNFGSLNVAISVDPPAPAWMAVPVFVLTLLVPLLVLGLVTWWWVRWHRRA